MAKGTLVVRILGDASDLQKTLGKTTTNLEKLGSKFQRVGTKLTAGLTAPIVLMGKKLFEAGETAATSDARITNIAESMGRTRTEAEKLTARLVDYANATALLTGIDQNSIKATQAKLLTFSHLADTADDVGGAFDRATAAAIDLEAAGFGTAEENATQLGKALQDPIKGLTALSRSGLTFSDTEKERIKTLVESNRVGEAQAMILAAIEQQVGGTAEATANASDKMRAGFSQAAEAVGTALLPMFEKLTEFVTNRIVPAFERFAALDEGTQKIIFVIAGLLAALGPVLVIVGTLMKLFAAIAPVIAFVASPIGLVVVALAALAAGLVFAYKRSETFRKIVDTAFAAVKKVVTAVMAVVRTVIVRVITVLTAAWARWGDTIKNFTAATFGNISKVIRGVMNIIRGIVNVVLGVLTGDWRRAWDGVKSIVSGAVQVVKGLISQLVLNVGGIPKRIVSALGNLGRLLFNAGKAIIRGLVDGIKNMAGNVVGAVKGVLQKARNLLPFSPAKEGPFSGKGWTLYSGQSIGESLAKGITDTEQDVAGAAAGVAGVASDNLRVPVSAGSGGVSVGSSAETNRLLRDLLAEMRRGGDVYLDGSKVGRSMVRGIQATQGSWRT